MADFAVSGSAPTTQDERAAAGMRPTGQDLFDAMTKDEQDEQFGAEVAQKLRSGEITLADLVRRVAPGETPGFVVAKPMKDVLPE